MSAKEEKRLRSFWNAGKRKRGDVLRSKNVTGGYLVSFALRRFIVNQSSFVDSIIYLCVNWSGVPGASVAGRFPDKKFFVLRWLN